MKIKSKYKIARRLGAGVFEKTQGPKFALNLQRRQKLPTRPSSVFGKQMVEKQKVRYTYGVLERQFSKYAEQAIKKGGDPAQNLFLTLEKRLDNIVLRAGFATTRLQARQMVSHGHITVNGKRVTIPSYQVGEKDILAVKESSKKKNLFFELEKRISETNIPSWIKVNGKEASVSLQGEPKLVPHESFLDFVSVIEFYRK